MRQTTQLYKTLRAQTGSYYEVRVTCGNTVYGMDKLISVTLTPALFTGSGPQIGGVQSTQCELTLLESSVNWPRMAQFTVDIRLCSADGTLKDVWMTMGTYYTDERRTGTGGQLTIIAFDGMLLLERSWTSNILDPPDSWPVTAKKAVEMLSGVADVEIDPRTILDDNVAFIGLREESTARETFADVAAGMGGNWHMTPEGKLRLVPFVNPAGNPETVAGSAIVGLAVVGSPGYSDVGTAVQDLVVGNVLSPVTGVELTDDAGITAESGTDDGYVVKGTCNFASTEAAQLCAAQLNGYQYRAFEARAARLDPATELGDSVYLGDTYFVAVSIKWHLGPKITADLTAAFENEVDHEFVVLTERAKTYRKSVAYTDRKSKDVFSDAQSAINQSATAIEGRVAASYVKGVDLSDTLANYSKIDDITSTYITKEQSKSDIDAVETSFRTTTDTITGSISTLQSTVDGNYETITSYIRYVNEQIDGRTVGTVIIGVTGSQSVLKITNEKISMFSGSKEVSYWDKSAQVTPSSLTIPCNSGNEQLTVGRIIFKPRTNGHMSLIWDTQTGS